VSTEQARAALAAVKLPQLPPGAVAFLADPGTRLDQTERAIPAGNILGDADRSRLALRHRLPQRDELDARSPVGRRRELSIRLALGGSRWRIVRLLMIESMGLALTASLVVTLAARWLFPPLIALVTGSESARYVSFWDWRTLGCIAALSVLAVRGRRAGAGVALV